MQVSEINQLLSNQQRYSQSHTDEEYNSYEVPAPPSPTGQMRAELEDMRLYGDIFPHVPAWSSRDLLVGQFSRDAKMDEIIKGIPTQTQCVHLIRAYLAGYHVRHTLSHRWNEETLTAAGFRPSLQCFTACRSGKT